MLQEWRTSTESGPSIPQPCWSIDDSGVKESAWSPAGKALSFEAKEKTLSSDNNDDMTFERDQPFSWTCWVHGDARGAIFGKMNEAQAYRGVDSLILGDGRLKVHLISAWDANAIAVLSKDALPSKWNHVAVTYVGNSKAAGFRIYVDGKPVATTTERDSLTESTVTEASV